MKIVVDEAIPFLKGVLEPYAEVEYLSGVKISAEDVRDADALMIRTRTRCDEKLLSGSNVKMIATATIGFDHIDLEWCQKHGIEVSTAAGCNARGVLQWVAAVLVALSKKDGWQPSTKTLGIVGVGHVGSLVKAYAEKWGFRVVCCDPPREEKEHCGFLPLEEVARQADILTFHTPLDASTHHLISQPLLSWLKPDAVVLNSSRGAVMDTESVLEDAHRFVCDVWEHEPQISATLLARVLWATPHVAGYSEQGKAVATSMAVASVARHFGWKFEGWYPPQAAHPVPREISWEELCRSIEDFFPLDAQSQYLKSHPEEFEYLRDHYNYRKEYF